METASNRSRKTGKELIWDLGLGIGGLTSPDKSQIPNPKSHPHYQGMRSVYFLRQRLSVIPLPVAAKLEGRGCPGAAMLNRASSPTQSRMPRLTVPFPAPPRLR